MAENIFYNKLIERVMSERPDLAPYMELFQEASKSNGTSDTEIRQLNVEAKLRKLSSIVRLLKEDLEEAMDELDLLARALGACEDCWGEDRRCPKCNGRGGPGFRTPEKRLFNQYVLPAVQKASWIELKDKTAGE